LLLLASRNTDEPVSALVFHHPDCAYFTAAESPEPAAVS
jgi:hypothetical protein